MDAVQLREALEQSGWRYTRQRAAVYNYLSTVDSHPTAEDVYAAVRQQVPKISLATVYKALEALVNSKLANKLTNSDGATRYDSHCDPHYHFRCTQTGQVHDLGIPFDAELLDKLNPDLKKEVQRFGFEVTGYRLEVLGRPAQS